MTDVARCQETIASYVLDAGEPVSYRALASQIGGGASSAVCAQALAAFCAANASAGGVGAVHVSIVKSASARAKSVDPRARVIRVSTAPKASAAADASIYGVFPSASTAAESDESVHEAMTLALWAQERKVRNDMFAGRTRHAPLSRELQAFYESDVQCTEATSRADMMAGSRGEDAVSVFDSVKATSSGRAQPATSKSSFFKSSGTASSSSTAASKSSAASSSSSSSFFKSSGNGTSTSTKTKSTAAAAPAKTSTETKRIDAKAMNNVLSVDSDSDEDEDDGGAPQFVKSTPATKARATKRVMISDDEDNDVEMVEAPPAKKPTSAGASRPSAKRKLSDSPEPATKKPSSPAKAESPKRKRVEEETVDEEEPQPEEEEALPTGPIKRRELVNKTRITDDGYMVTEKVYEEVEVSVEELQKERAEAKKKQAAAKAAADAQKARAAAAAAANNGTKSAKSAGPAKQKKLDFFFTRK